MYYKPPTAASRKSMILKDINKEKENDRVQIGEDESSPFERKASLTFNNFKKVGFEIQNENPW